MTPSYKNAATGASVPAPTTHSNPLTGLVKSVVGHEPTTYKTVGGSSATSPAPSWSFFGSTPTYKTAPLPTDGLDDGSCDVDVAVDAAAADVDDTSGCVPGPDQIVVL